MRYQARLYQKVKQFQCSYERSKNETLMDAIVALTKEDREILEKRANNRRFKNKLQRMRGEVKDEL
eukprot:15352424-Ditylum_brightwellii.AAC.1